MEVLDKEKTLELAKKLAGEGRLDKALLEYRRIAELDPKDMRIRIRIAELLARQKKSSEAVKVYREVADSYSNDGFYLKAVTVYKSVLRLNPSLVEVNYKLAELYERMGLGRDAIHQYQILANALEQKGDYNALVDVRKKIVELDPRNTANRIRLAETYQYQGKDEESLGEYEKLVGEVRGSGNTEQLIELYEKIVSYKPEDVPALNVLIGLYWRRGEWKKVVSHLEKAKGIAEDEPELSLMQADAYAHLNQYESAKRKYKDSAVLFTEKGDTARALDVYKELLVIAPDEEPDVRVLMDAINPAAFERLKKSADERREAAAAGKSEKPEEPAGRCAFVRGVSSAQRFREADSAFELGKAYLQTGLSDEAAPELKKALALYRELERAGEGGGIPAQRIKAIEDLRGSSGSSKKDDKGISKPAIEKKEVRKREWKKAEKKEERREPKKKDKRVGFV